MTRDAALAEPRCSALAQVAGEPLAGSAPHADAWVVVEHPSGWGDAALTRSEHGVRVLMARGPRGSGPDPAGRVRVWVAYCAPDPVLRLGLVDDPADVAGWDLAGLAGGSHRHWGDRDPRPLLLVCANGRRDRCCGHSGGRLAEQLWGGPLGAQVLTCTHLGGHRFAPTALLLPWGALHGRLALDSCLALLEQATQGRMPGATLRGFSSQPEPAQVAEAHVRNATGHEGLAPLPVALVANDDPQRMGAQVATPASGGSPGSRVDVQLVRTTRTVVPSCGRDSGPATRWSALGPPAGGWSEQGPPAGRNTGDGSGTMRPWTSDWPDART